MSKIKDLYAEVNDIDDLKPVKSIYNKEFFDRVQKDDEERAIKQIFDKGKTFKGAHDWFYDKAEFGGGYDDEGHYEIYFENFTELCDQAAMELTDAFIEEQHFDMDDDQYDRITNKVGDLLADYYADMESDIIAEYEDDKKEAWQQQVDYDNAVYDRRYHE